MPGLPWVLLPSPPPWDWVPASMSLREGLRLREPESLGTVTELALSRVGSGSTVRNLDEFSYPDQPIVNRK